uniref:Uncharacterized protein n=1 Tax=Rhizophora mucronata TaxID=61149 RepID=A0A2P2MBL5_RHIMU
MFLYTLEAYLSIEALIFRQFLKF